MTSIVALNERECITVKQTSREAQSDQSLFILSLRLLCGETANPLKHAVYGKHLGIQPKKATTVKYGIRIKVTTPLSQIRLASELSVIVIIFLSVWGWCASSSHGHFEDELVP